MHHYLTERLLCPVCHGSLNWIIEERLGQHIETGEAHCTGCPAIYPIREGIGLFLTPDLPRNDLWEQVDGNLVRHLRQHPALERQLLETPLGELGPTDRLLRAFVLEARGDFAAAKKAEAFARETLYTLAFRTCHQSQIDFLVDHLAAGNDPIVDLASGRGGLIEPLLQGSGRPLIMTDFSPNILRRNRRWLEHLGRYDRVSLLAFDARRTPFKDQAVTTLSTNLGLPNIEEPGQLVEELKRIVSGELLAICHFFPEDDQPNRQVIEQAGLETFVYRRSALAAFSATGWPAQIKNSCRGEAQPTPPSQILDGLRADGLPAADTELEWGILAA